MELQNHYLMLSTTKFFLYLKNTKKKSTMFSKLFPYQTCLNDAY